MEFDKKKIYFLEILLLLFLLFNLFVSNMSNRFYLMLVLIIFSIICKLFVKGRKIDSIYKKSVMWLSLGFALAYILILYLGGVFFGFYTNQIKVSIWSITNLIIPYSVIIVLSEYIRYLFLSRKDKVTTILITVCMILIDMILYFRMYYLNDLEGILTILGYLFFASTSCNLFYNYICNSFGNRSIILYRLITVLYTFIIPILPDIYIFFQAVYRIVYPYVMFLVIEGTFGKSQFVISYIDKRKNIIKNGLAAFIVISLIMLISCKFIFGIMVVGSGSMTGTIDMGDAVLFKQLGDSTIEPGDIIIFDMNDTSMIHRVIKKEVVNGDYVYYTKGDYNELEDNWIVCREDVLGIVKFKIKYIGWPSLWLRDMFDR